MEETSFIAYSEIIKDLTDSIKTLTALNGSLVESNTRKCLDGAIRLLEQEIEIQSAYQKDILNTIKKKANLRLV
jgi:hypothetical protein